LTGEPESGSAWEPSKELAWELEWEWEWARELEWELLKGWASESMLEPLPELPRASLLVVRWAWMSGKAC
jgi:hypothetical protein